MSSVPCLSSTAQRQFCLGLCLQLVLWSDGGYIYTDMERRTRAVLPSMLAGFAGYDAPRVPFAWRWAHALRHHGGYGPEGQFLRAQARGGFTGAIL